MKESCGPGNKYEKTPDLIDNILQLLIKYLTILNENSESSKRKTGLENNKVIFEEKFQKVASQWANNCVFDLIKPDDDCSIPALDALLAESGGWQSRQSHEMLMHDALIAYSKHLNGGEIEKHTLTGTDAENVNVFNERGIKRQWQKELQNDCSSGDIKLPFLAQMKHFIEKTDRKRSLVDLINDRKRAR